MKNCFPRMASRVEPLEQDVEVNNWRETFEQTTETTRTEKHLITALRDV